MDYFRLQAQTEAPKSRTPSLPLGLQSAIGRGPLPTVRRTADEWPRLREDSGHTDAQYFAHFASAWRRRLIRFLSDDPVSRA